MTTIYEATQNSDLTEGRGHDVTVGYFDHVEKAVLAIKGKGVMGVGDGDVWEITTGAPVKLKGHVGLINGTRVKVYGYRQNLASKWGYGYIDNRDELAKLADPEFQEFLRLKEKFEK